MRFPCQAARIAQPHPDEVKELVKADAAAFGGVVQQISVEEHEALADEGGSVRRLTRRVAQMGAITDANRPAMEKIPDSLQ